MNESNEPTHYDALFEQLSDAHPDLDRLAANAAREGGRIKRRRRAGAVLGGAGLAAAVGIALTVTGLPGGSTPTIVDPGFGGAPATSPAVSSSLSAEPTPLSTDTPAECPTVSLLIEPEVPMPVDPPTATPTAGLSAIVPTDAPPATEAVPTLCPIESEENTSPVGGEVAPVSIGLPEWQCGTAMDEKMICSAGEATVSIVWRSADHHDKYVAGPDKSTGYVSEIHGDIFVTVDVPPGQDSQIAFDVGASLIWH